MKSVYSVFKNGKFMETDESQKNPNFLMVLIMVLSNRG
jgi:hypothetical protein